MPCLLSHITKHKDSWRGASDIINSLSATALKFFRESNLDTLHDMVKFRRPSLAMWEDFQTRDSQKL